MVWSIKLTADFTDFADKGLTLIGTDTDLGTGNG
jgi:hypothetical protein